MKAKLRLKITGIFRLLFCGFAALCFSAEQKTESAAFVISSLDEALDLAISNSKMLKYQELNMLSNMHFAKRSIKNFIPTFSFSFSENDSVNLAAPDSRSKSVQFSLSQMVFDGGKAKLQYDLANTSALYAYYEYGSAVKQFESDVIRRYQEILLQKRKLEIQADLLKTAEMQLKIIEKQFELGLALETDYLEYHISVSSLRIERNQLEKELKKRHRALAVALSLPPETNVVIDDTFANAETYRTLGAHSDAIIAIVKAASRDLQKQQIQLLYQKKQAAQAKRVLLPDVSLEASMAFSGSSYPLTEPGFSLKCNIAFNNGLLPLNFSAGASAKKSRIGSMQDSANTSLPSSTTYFTERRLTDISTAMGELNFTDAELALLESVNDTIDAHDYATLELEQKRQVIALSKRRIEIDKIKLEKGELKHIDLLNEFIELSEAEISLVEVEYQIISYERVLEIMSNLPQGGILGALAIP